MTKKPNNFSIKQWPEGERPREKLIQFGAEQLTDAELLAILLRIGNEGASAIDVGRDLIARLGGLQGIDRAHAEDIMQIKGLGLAKTAQLKAAIEIGKRVRRLDVKPVSFDSAGAIARYCYPKFESKRYEQFLAFLLDGQNNLLAERIISEGIPTQSVVYTRKVMEEALRLSASAVVVVHNHPSGEATPSPQDIETTQKMRQAPKCFSTNWESFDRWSVNYNQAIMSMIDLRKGQYPVVELGSILELVQYGTSDKANITKNGTPVLRMNNIKDGVLDYTDLKHIKLSSKVRKSLLLKDGDILFNRTNSKELVGKCAVFHSDDEYVFASYLIRVKVNPTKADPDFVVYTLNAVIGRQQIDAISRQIIGQANINSQELRSLNIPLPPLKVQQSIMKRVESGCAKIQQIKEDSEQLEKETSSNIEKLILGTLSVEDL